MATANTASIERQYKNTFKNESTSFVSVAGDQASTITLPLHQVWKIETLRATNNDTVARDIEFQLTDADGVVHVVLSNSTTGRNSIPAGSAAVWNGSVAVPGGWKVSVKWYGLAVSTNQNWQYTAVSI